MKIKREDLYSFEKFGKYIKSKCNLVSQVYESSIYFGHFSWILQWSNYKYTPTREQEDLILRAINGACNTEFEFED